MDSAKNQFLDANGVRWTLALNVQVIKRVRERLSVNLLDIVDGRLVERLESDPELLVGILCEILQLEGAGAEAFSRAMTGDALDAAAEALLEGLLLFFPKRRRLLMRALLEKTEQVMAAAATETARQIAGIDPGSLVKAAGNSAGGSPASAASTRCP